MTTSAQLRKAAQTDPEVVEDTAGGARTYSVAGEEFASLDAEGFVHLRLPASEAEDMTGRHETAQRVEHGVRVPIKDINGQALNYWVRRAWLSCAPPERAARAMEADLAAAGGVGDLPKAIGKPATRALANAGITTLDQVAALSDAELNALHGVGPKAVKILRDALATR
ncbi:hypothetical protein [Stackebrandtia albiflava]|nr:hypothetical protein [Stackebrandtia albiflava]